MEEHPIEGLMVTAMESIKDMIDVNTIIGDPIETSNNIVIIPISKVGFGFASGGSEFNTETIEEYSKKDKDEQINYKLPFGGGSGAGVSISPIAFLVIQDDNVKLMPVCHSSALDKLLDYIPDLMEKVNTMINKQMFNKREERKEAERKLENLRREAKEELNQVRRQGINNDTEILSNGIQQDGSNMSKVQPKRMPKHNSNFDEIEDEN